MDPDQDVPEGQVCQCERCGGEPEFCYEEDV